MIDETHDPKLRSWVESANRPGCDFPIQNLPLGVFRVRGRQGIHTGVRIGDCVLDLVSWVHGEDLRSFMALSAAQRRDLRVELSKALRSGARKRRLYGVADCEMLLPVNIGDYTDFYASLHHATNVGAIFRPGTPLLPNYRHVPIAYHGRSSSIVPSGTPVHRPSGQLGEGNFGPTAELDYEVEIGAFLGPGNPQGSPVPIGEAGDQIAGLCLLNDWSARDIQRWEYQPLGPFLGKNFATSISPWIVTSEALEPFRVQAAAHDTAPLPYLRETAPGGFAITVEAWLRTARTPEPVRLSRAAFSDLYWSLPQMIAHHTVNGCPLRPGDLIASGAISGPEKSHRGCLLELTWKGTDPIHLGGGESRAFLEDGDSVTLSAFCEREGFTRIAFGICEGTVLHARDFPFHAVH